MAGAKKGRAWVVAVNMGYGHQRATAPLAELAPEGRIIAANDYEGIPKADKNIWDRSESFYYFVSRLKEKNALGRFIFSLFDKYQRIGEFDPSRREIAPTMQVRKQYAQLARGWGKHLIEILAAKPLPIITSFFSVAFMAEYFDYPNEIYLLVTDSDISRAWAPFDPAKSRIKYLTPSERATKRLKTYGVKPANITYTGFPLPQSLIGTSSAIAKKNLKSRVTRLGGAKGPVSLAFVIGGAGVQIDIGIKILRSLGTMVRNGKINLYLVAGTSEKASKEFSREITRLNLRNYLGKSLHIVFDRDKQKYFSAFDTLLARIDILWTKPSELSFYAALGLPIIIAPPVGSQEIQNRAWLLEIGSGIDQLAPESTHEWLPKMIAEGRLANAALQGFMHMERRGTENILNIFTP